MDFPLSSSVILVIIVVLWFFWVAPYFLRSRLQHHGAAVELPAERFSAGSPDPLAMTVLSMAAQQETAMDTRKTTAAPTGAPASVDPTFRVRYGRCVIALAGLLSLVTGLVTLLLLPFGAVSGMVPAVAVLLTFASVILLRALAVRDRRNKARRASAAAASSLPAPEQEEAVSASPASAVRTHGKDAAPFDGESRRGQDAAPLNSGELRAAALAVAVAAGDASASVAAAARPSMTPWEPVEVPKPVYVDAAKAERPEPEPLQLPEAPKASARTMLRQPAAAEPRTEAAGKPGSALNNLDDVLQRRRA